MTENHPAATRRLSLITPSGRLTLGNLLGALRPMAARQPAAGTPADAPDACFYGVADLHAMTTEHDPARLAELTRETQTLLLAAGLDPQRVTVFRQSRVPTHTAMAYLLECTAFVGELDRMIQFKEKRRAGGTSGTRVSLFTYPVLMAADILLYSPHEIPVGDDQRQHVELTRDVAQRFNQRYGAVLTVPRAVHPAAGARVMDLADPTRKMSKSAREDAAGVVRLLDGPDVVRRKVARAVTDSDTGPDAVRADRDAKPGVTNLLDVAAACTGLDVAELADRAATYGALKRLVTDAVVALLEPVQRRYAELAADPAHVEAVYAEGEQRCLAETAPVLVAARTAMGL
jgi:tryptophanyl-tRNA synthetase